jgi:hypothetical protein
MLQLALCPRLLLLSTHLESTSAVLRSPSRSARSHMMNSTVPLELSAMPALSSSTVLRAFSSDRPRMKTVAFARRRARHVSVPIPA